MVVLAVMLFCDRDVAPVFGHLSPLAGSRTGETALRRGSPRARSLAPAAAWAHATLKSEYPVFGTELKVAPKLVKLHFDQYVDFPSIQVYNAKGKTYALQAVAHGLNVVGAAARGRCRRGAYTVRWHVLSADGHVVSGVWTFGVRVKAPPPTDAFGAGGPTRTEHVVRWLYFLSFALLIGSLGFRLLALRGAPVPPRGREAPLRSSPGPA